MALEQPKKPVGGAYGSFLTAKRADFAKLCVGKPTSEVSKMAGEEWKRLSETEKAPYQKSYEEAKAKYDADMAAFLEAGGVKSKGAMAQRAEKRKAKDGGGKAKRAKKDPDAPKRPAGGGYGCFMAKHREAFQKECPGSVAGVAKLAGERWKALPEADREPFDKEYQAKKAAYDEAMKTYVPLSADAEDGDEDEDGDEGEAEDEEDKEAAELGDAKTPKAAEKKAAGEAKKAEVAAKNGGKKEAAAAKKAAEKKAAGEAKKAEVTAKNGGKKEAAAAKKAEAAAKKDQKKGASAAKKAAGRGKKAAEPEVDIPKGVLDKAEQAGVADALKKLIARDDVKAQGITPKNALAALEESGGLLHKARRALLGGA